MPYKFEIKAIFLIPTLLDGKSNFLSKFLYIIHNTRIMNSLFRKTSGARRDRQRKVLKHSLSLDCCYFQEKFC